MKLKLKDYRRVGGKFIYEFKRYRRKDFGRMLRYVGFNGNGMGSSSCLESYIGRVFMKYISED